jgi:hypothetical protein
MDHEIYFKDADDMILWLVDNDIEDVPVSLIIHLGEQNAD